MYLKNMNIKSLELSSPQYQATYYLKKKIYQASKGEPFTKSETGINGIFKEKKICSFVSFDRKIFMKLRIFFAPKQKVPRMKQS